MLKEFLSAISWFDLPLISTALFVAIFLAVLIRVCQKARQPEYQRMASLPLDDGAINKEDN